MQKPVKVYTPLMRYEKILFAINDLELPFPVTFRQIGFFFASLIGMIIMVNLPGLGFMKPWWLINFAVIPIGLTWFFTKFKLDGKAPHIYIWDYIQFQTSSRVYNRYEKADSPKIYQYKSVVTYRKGAASE